MSRQMKKKYIDKHRIEVNKLQNKIYELEYLFQIKYNACDELLQDNKQLSREKNKIISERDSLKNELKDKNRIIKHLMTLKENYRIENRNLKAENYCLKNRGFFQRVLNRG